jgi:hypothetical protein
MLSRILILAATLSTLAPAAQPTVVNEAGPGPAEHGAAALRAVARPATGSVRLAVSRDLPAEAFRIAKTAGGYRILGGDARGVLYGALDAAGQIRLSGAIREKQSQPSLGIRGLKFNIPLPGTGYLSEEDLAHNQWFWNLDYWARFLDMAARNRYNAITFWSAHPYGRMVRIAKYPEAAEVPAAELDRNIAFFRRLFQMAADRGLDTYLVTWNIHVSRPFAEKRGIAAAGFDSPDVRDYQREAIKSLFATYPMLTGLGTTVGERMPGMTIQQKLDWIADTYFAALREVGRPVPFILRYWQSEPKPMAAMLAKVKHSAPVYLDIKFNGEHMYSSPKPHVLDPKWVELARQGRWKLLWHLRNDCIFILRWGDPDFVRDTVRSMMGPDAAGFVEGSELDVPGTDRIHTAEAKPHLDWEYKFEKHWFRYMLWGRLGYDAAEPDSTWKAHFTHRFGAAGNDVFDAMRQAGKIVPQITSYHWNYMNGDWYPEGSIGSWNTSYEQPRVNYRRAAMYHDVRTYIFNNTIDSTMANIPEFVAGASKAPGPLEIAARLEGFGKNALAALARARGKVERGRKEFTCTDSDLEAYGNLGIYYAEKLRGAAHLAQFLFTGNRAGQQTAVADLGRAAAAWRNVAAATGKHYIPHEVWLFGQFHWNLYTADVERDVAIAREASPLPKGSTYGLEGLHDWLEYAAGLLRWNVVPPATAPVAPVRVEAEAAASVTPRFSVGEDASASGGKYIGVAPAPKVEAGNAITGARDYVTSANSATYRFELPADGTYQVWVMCWWEGRSDNFGVFVDEGATRVHTLRAGRNAPLQKWTLQELDPALYLGKGSHTLRFFARSAGSRIDRFVVAPAGADAAAVR